MGQTLKWNPGTWGYFHWRLWVSMFPAVEQEVWTRCLQSSYSHWPLVKAYSPVPYSVPGPGLKNPAVLEEIL